MKKPLNNYVYLCTLCHKEHGTCSCDNTGEFRRYAKNKAPKVLYNREISPGLFIDYPDRIEPKDDVLVCPKCWNKLEECECSDWPKKVNQIDAGLCTTIKILNKKGYTTLFCCEGHYNDSYGAYISAYLYFREPIPDEYFPILPTFPIMGEDKIWSRCKTPIMTIGRSKKRAGKGPHRTFRWTGTRYKRVTREQKDLEHKQFLKELEEWAANLPEREDIKHLLEV